MGQESDNGTEQQIAVLEKRFPETRELSLDNLEAYIGGCEEIAVRLHDTIQKVLEQGKRPVILIPSRGAVPIYLLVRRFLNEVEGEDCCLSDRNIHNFPEGIFSYLEGKKPKKNEEGPGKVDVVLFPFTADVSIEPKGDERLAQLLRNSCARSVLEIVAGADFKSYDFAWYEFLMNKLSLNERETLLKPKSITTSLENYPKSEDPQIILIDTVISGRAANDITEAFVSVGHPVIPLLAVDSTKGGKFSRGRKAEIERTIPLEYWHEKGHFVDFPLLTEDKGAALLGVVALNIRNFNEESFFHQVNKRFRTSFTPQSCIWTLPPRDRERFLLNFRRFLETTWQCRSSATKGQIDIGDITTLRAESFELTSTHPAPSIDELRQMIQVPSDTEAKETKSHIVSIKLPEETAHAWINEFVNERARNNYSAP